MAQHPKKTVLSGIGRSPAYPFIPLERAVARISQLWGAVGRAEVDVPRARQHWGYGPNSSGGIQTEAALKQFGLLDVSGRGEDRRLRLSDLAVRLVSDQTSDAERHKLLQQAAVNPKIHRELWDKWDKTLPLADVRRFLTRDREFIEKGANDVIAEYQKTMAYVATIGSSAGTGHASVPATEQAVESSVLPDQVSQRLSPATKKNEIKVLVDGNHLSVSAVVDRHGLKKLMQVLEANSALLDESKGG